MKIYSKIYKDKYNNHIYKGRKKRNKGKKVNKNILKEGKFVKH